MSNDDYLVAVASRAARALVRIDAGTLDCYRLQLSVDELAELGVERAARLAAGMAVGGGVAVEVLQLPDEGVVLIWPEGTRAPR